MNTQYVIDVKNLYVDYITNNGNVPAVKDVGFSLNRRETLCLVGESGSGKTTVANAIPKLLPDSAKVAGRVSIDGESIYDLDEYKVKRLRREKISFIFQDPIGSLIPTVQIGKQIERVVGFRLNLNGKKIKKDKAYELLNHVGLRDIDRIWYSYPSQLSGGMCQRVMIAMALAVEPLLVIADEPVSALDAITQEKIMDLLKKLQKEYNFSMLLITHDMRIAAHYSDIVGVMKEGNLLELKPTKLFFNNSEHNYSKELIKSASKLSI